MPDFTMTITNVFSPNTIIRSGEMNTNLLNDIRDTFNSMIDASLGHTHSGTVGDGPKLTQDALSINATSYFDDISVASGTILLQTTTGDPLTSLIDKQVYVFRANRDHDQNLPTFTVQIDALAPRNLVRTDGQSLTENVILDGRMCFIQYNQGLDRFEFLNSGFVSVYNTANSGIASIQYASSANSRDYTLIDAGANADFVLTEANQSINGEKEFSERVDRVSTGSSEPVYSSGTGFATTNNALNTDNSFMVAISGDQGLAGFHAGDSANPAKGTFNYNHLLNAWVSNVELLLPDVSSPSSANLMSRRSPAKAWANVSAIGTLNDSFNVSSITKIGAGRYQVNLIQSFTNSFYVVVATSGSSANAQFTALTTTDFEVRTQINGINTDSDVSVASFGDQ